MQHYCEIPTPKGVMRGFFHKPNCDKHPVCLIFMVLQGRKQEQNFVMFNYQECWKLKE